MKKIVKGILIGLTIFFFVFALTIMILGIRAIKNNQVLTVFGYTFSVVPTTSMANLEEENPIMQYEFVLGHQDDYGTLEVGDDIIYYSERHKFYIVHRIIEKTEEGFITKGTNNLTQDEDPVTEEMYVSKVISHSNILHVGELVVNNRSIIFLALIGIFILIIATEVLNILKLTAMKKNEQNKIEKEKALEATREQIKKELIEEMAKKENK